MDDVAWRPARRCPHRPSKPDCRRGDPRRAHRRALRLQKNPPRGSLWPELAHRPTAGEQRTITLLCRNQERNAETERTRRVPRRGDSAWHKAFGRSLERGRFRRESSDALSSPARGLHNFFGSSRYRSSLRLGTCNRARGSRRSFVPILPADYRCDRTGPRPAARPITFK